jgi:DhnA family fructose-bisphosphate aldolase class Ia
VKALTRQAVELGADIIKADPTDSIESYREVVGIARGIPLLPRGGGKVSDQEILSRTSALMKAGAAGVVYGRNIFQHPNIAGMIRAIRAVVHEDADVQSALRALNPDH